MGEDNREKITKYLSTFITEHKLNLIEEVLAQRTNHITVALEDIYQPHNASAVVRSADCFGIHQVHIIEGRNEYEINPQVVQGSAKWVDIVKHSDTSNNTKACFSDLKAKGYKLVGTTPHEKGMLLDDLNPEEPFALIYGTEETGLSDYAMEHVDEYLRIPMYGFTESFNLSVSAAICLHQLTSKLRASETAWQLSNEEKAEIRLNWYKKVVRRSGAVIDDYLSSRDQ